MSIQASTVCILINNAGRDNLRWKGVRYEFSLAVATKINRFCDFVSFSLSLSFALSLSIDLPQWLSLMRNRICFVFKIEFKTFHFADHANDGYLLYDFVPDSFRLHFDIWNVSSMSNGSIGSIHTILYQKAIFSLWLCEIDEKMLLKWDRLLKQTAGLQMQRAHFQILYEKKKTKQNTINSESNGIGNMRNQNKIDIRISNIY